MKIQKRDNEIKKVTLSKVQTDIYFASSASVVLPITPILYIPDSLSDLETRINGIGGIGKINLALDLECLVPCSSVCENEEKQVKQQCLCCCLIHFCLIQLVL